ncbi:hypothetical protein HID58_018983 [Brassica napus]|uniref:Uncharacterized protein n=1 Tax=Brassica napus TaxID=3708 RepID=A0ABQ8DBG7_BRANA|nr:hypothetical protein HID58_018983 [Brassica napus]
MELLAHLLDPLPNLTILLHHAVDPSLNFLSRHHLRLPQQIISPVIFTYLSRYAKLFHHPKRVKLLLCVDRPRCHRNAKPKALENRVPSAMRHKTSYGRMR